MREGANAGVKKSRGCWAEVNLDNIVYNAEATRELVQKDMPNVKCFIPIVKASAYGHGITEVAKALYESDPNYYFGVATLSEALLVRGALPEARILIISHTPDYLVEEALRHNITLTISCLPQALLIQETAEKLKKRAVVHIKLDTGMHRIGFPLTDESVADIAKITKLPNLYAEGLFTHFATAYMREKRFVHIQYKRYKDFEKKLTDAGLSFDLVHISNAGIILDNPEYHQNTVRFGSLLYGVYSSPEVNASRIKIKDALSVRAEISYINKVAAFEGIGYDHTYHTTRESMIATLPIGWADLGIRLSRNRGVVLVHGVRCPIVGCVCMDQMMVDVTLLPAVFVLVMALWKKPALPILIGSVAIASILAIFLQGNNMLSMMAILDSGFVSNTGVQDIDTLLSRGGFVSQHFTASLGMLGIAYGGVLEKSGVLEVFISKFDKITRTTGGLVATTIAALVIFNFATGSQFLAIVLGGRMFVNKYKERDFLPQTFSRLIEDGGTVTSPLVPWGLCGIFFFNTLGVPTSEYFIYAVFCYAVPIISVTYGFTNKFMWKTGDIKSTRTYRDVA